MTAILWILAVLTTAAVAYFTYRADARRELSRPWLTTTLRALLLALVWLLLLAPSIFREKQETLKPVIVLLQDESTSIPIALKADTARYRESVQALIAKLSDKYRVISWGFGGGIKSDSLFRFEEPATDISAALSRAQEFFGQQNLGAVVLATDGRFNQGVHPLFQNLALRSPLYTVAIGDSLEQKDLRIAGAYAPRTVTRGSQFEIRSDVVALACDGHSGSVTLIENGSSLGTQNISVTGNRYDRAAAFVVQADKPGLHHYVVNASAASGERNLANNRRDVFVEVVEDKKSILIAAAAPHPDIAALREALAGLETYTITVRTDGQLPEQLSSYTAIILHSMPGNDAAQTAALQAARRPIWFIAGAGTNTGALAQLQAPAAMSPGGGRDAQPAVGSSFSLFNLPARLASVTDRMPPLSIPGNVTQADPRSAVLLTQRGFNNAPLWLLKPGSPSTALLAGEGIWRWRLYEYRYFKNHEAIDECIRQTLSFLTANAAEKQFRVELPKYVWSDAEAVTMQAYLLNAANEPVNPSEVKLTITDSSNRSQQFSFERSGNAYRLQLGILAGGAYRYTATTSYEGKNLTAGGALVVNTLPLESLESGADYPMLYSLAAKYNGSMLPETRIASLYDTLTRNENIKPIIQTHTESVPIIDWKWYFFLILAVATTEWLVRKYWMAM